MSTVNRHNSISQVIIDKTPWVIAEIDCWLMLVCHIVVDNSDPDSPHRTETYRVTLDTPSGYIVLEEEDTEEQALNLYLNYVDKDEDSIVINQHKHAKEVINQQQ